MMLQYTQRHRITYVYDQVFKINLTTYFSYLFVNAQKKESYRYHCLTFIITLSVQIAKKMYFLKKVFERPSLLAETDQII